MKIWEIFLPSRLAIHPENFLLSLLNIALEQIFIENQ